MKQITSFLIDHDKLQRGMYVSRIDGDIVTYDIRMAIPNSGNYLAMPAMHSFEHLFATYARNSILADGVIYVGPMGCRTGFYLLLRDISHADALALVRDAINFIAEFDGPVPGAQFSRECGNYREHDLEGAKEVARSMIPVLKDWTVADMDYDAHNA